jgi:hypothetical protein
VAQTYDGEYYKFDDRSVQAVSLSAVLDTNPYMVMYEREPQVPSVPQKSAVSAAATEACAVNGQKTSLSQQGLVSHENGSLVNDRQGCDSNSTAYTCDEHDKERKNCCEEIQMILSQPESKNFGISDGDEHGERNERRNRKRKGDSEGPKATEGDTHGGEKVKRKHKKKKGNLQEVAVKGLSLYMVSMEAVNG